MSQIARPRLVSKVYLASSKFSQQRSYKVSAKLFSNATTAEEASEQKIDYSNPENFDFSVLQPKLRVTTPSSTPRKQSKRTYTAEQKDRSTMALRRMQSRVLAHKGDNPGDNQRIIDESAAGNDTLVWDMWMETTSTHFVISMDAYASILISLSRLENEGFAVDVAPLIAGMNTETRRATPIVRMILMEHYTKLKEYAKARREYITVIELANVKFEDLQEAHDDLIDSGRTVPDNLKGPLFNIFEHCSFESMDALMDCLQYYMLVISSAENTAGPLSRRRIIEAMTKQWNSTELGKLLPFANAEEILTKEEDITSRFLRA